MMKAAELRTKAHEYFERAQKSFNPWTKSLLLIIADDYLNMAIQAETPAVRPQHAKADQARKM
jgi:hypothetical protein